MSQLPVVRDRLLHISKFALLLLALLPCLIMLIFQAKERSIQHRMRKELDRVPLITIHINQPDLTWVEEGREIMVDGRMFDVRSIEITNGICIVSGLFDDEETALLKHMKKTKDEENNNGRILEEFFGFEATPNELTHEPFPFLILTRNFTGYSAAIMVRHVAIITPPPRC